MNPLDQEQQRLIKLPDVLAACGLDADDIKRFWANIRQCGPNECWEYQRTKGYGSFRSKGRKWRANRLALIISSGRDEAKLHALHSCDNPPCCNPSHLRWGTHSENMQDLVRNMDWLEKTSSRWRQSGVSKRRLLPTQVSYIRLLIEGGYSNRVIASWYCVSRSAISALKIGRTYSTCQ